MGRGHPLTDEDRGRIQGLSEGDSSARAIAKKVKRSRDYVQRRIALSSHAAAAQQAESPLSRGA
ncbi:hypothetical protein PC116_g19628 [Phytophthora cactorum]|nr:hypothetical protein PC114_g20914 [Phytophthora cactorum]KAG2962080.1 hypothetical protein PC120_g27733 [Phytophthora cactorum]KAG3039179.1 hypothetical protein PC119_g2372 [Phytophthora cactorum]KAG3142587.1 hypothetical protein C6341_g19375 [Phytophthora cactorum]KAG3197765.1 hypothetical protein PC128_g6583 [Phytophthora cactorum]